MSAGVSEFAEIQQTPSPSCIVGNDTQNRKKNRYCNIIPADLTRVKLSRSNGGHDYINANYILCQTPQTAPRYIAAQAPLDHTVCDFWKMIWQQRSGLIISLTKLTERGAEKCARWWPLDTSLEMTRGPFKISLKSTKTADDFILRTIGIRLDFEPERIIHQIHFEEWPDHGTADPSSLRRLSKYSQILTDETIKEGNNGPMVVHCSAGVGRTGVFIASDIALRKSAQGQEVDIKEIVKKMRQERAGMVQNLAQYLLIYKIINEDTETSQSE